MKKTYFILFIFYLIVIANANGQVNVSTGRIVFNASLHTVSGSTYTFNDSTYIAQDGIPFKSLLFSDGLIQFDTTTPNEFKLIGQQKLYAKVGNSTFQLLWNKTTNDTAVIVISKLMSDTGITVSNGASIVVSGAPVVVQKMRIWAATDSVLVNSSVGINGVLLLPETGGAITHTIDSNNWVLLTDTANNLSSFTIAIDTSFYIRGFGYRSNQLKFTYNENTRKFALYGGIVYRIDSNDIPGMLGDSVNPGMVYTNGSISQLRLTVTDTFRLFKQKFYPEQFTIALNNQDSVYAIYGKLGFELKGTIIRLSLGDSAQPGAIGNKDKLVHFAGSINDTFSFRQLHFKPNGLTLAYDTNGTSGRFYAYGNVTTVIKGDSANADSINMEMGNKDFPGIEIIDGELQQMALAATADFKLKNIVLQPDTVGFRYERTTDVFNMYGRLGVEVDSTTYHIDAGTINSPGIVIANGKLSLFRVSIDDTLSIRGFKLKPNQLTFQYDTLANNAFSVFGSATAIIKGDSTSPADTILTLLGTETNPGMRIENGIVQHVNLGLNGTFHLKQVAITPDSLRFQYDRSSKLFELFGGISATVDSVQYKAQLGTDSIPGVQFSKDQLIHFEAMIIDTIAIKQLRFLAQPITFTYDTSGNNTFSLFGNAIVYVGQDTIKTSLGSRANPGIVIRDGKLQSLNAGITAGFSLKQLYIAPDSLTIAYDGDSARFVMFGGARFAIERDTLKVALGNMLSPGIVIRNRSLERLEIGITDTISIKSLKLIPRGLTFQYQTGNSFAMFGNVTSIIESDTIQGVLGTRQLPGFLVNNGILQQLNIGIIKSKFELKRMGFEADTLVFRYNRIQNRYELFGDVTIEFDSNRCEVNLGTDQAPGVVLANGILQRLSIGVTDTIRIRNIIFEPQALTFQYDQNANEYELFGTANTIIQSDTIKIDLGSDTLPGMRIRNGELEDFSIGISAEFKLKSIDIIPRNLTFYYHKAIKQFGMYGTLDIRFDSNYIDLNMGTASNPGLAINTQNGDIEHINLTTTDTFMLYSLVLRPVNFNFSYTRATGRYSMYGSVMAALKSDTIELSLGDSAMPGFIYQQGTLQQLRMSISDSLTLYQLRMKSKGLTFEYVRSLKQYKVYGDVTLAFSNEKIEAILGNQQSPGIVIENSEVQSINFGISGDLAIGGVKFNAQQATFVYDKQNNYYEMYGTLGFTLENESITANLGTPTLPGFTIRNGELYELNIGITSDIKIGGLRVSTQNVGLFYEREQNKSLYVIRGTVAVQELWSISVSLGTPTDPTKGLEIMVDQNGNTQVDVTDFLIEAKHVNFGGVTFNDIRVRYNKLPNGFSIGGELDVVFPPGFEVGGKLAFTEQNGRFTLDTIALKYDAGNTEGIEIGETGIFLTHMEGEVDRVPGSNLDYKFSGDVVVIAGGKITIANTSYAMLRIEGKAEADKDHLFLDNNIQIAAYNTNNKWEGLYGSGEVSVDINWKKGEYTVKGSLTYYSMVEFKAEAYYHTNGTMGAMGEVDLVVPDFIPIIGGSTLAGIDGAVRYSKHDLNNSVAAGWTTVNLEVKTVTIGAEYNFGKNRVRKIGASDVKNLQTAISSDDNATQRIDFFMINDHTKAVTLKIKLNDPSQSGLFISSLISGALFNQASMRLYTPQPGQQGMIDIGKHLLGGTYNPQQPYTSPDYVFYYDTVNVNGIVIHFTGLATNHNEALPVGMYNLITKMPVDVPAYTIEVQSHYMSPLVVVNGLFDKTTRNVEVKYESSIYINDSARIHLYETDTPSYNGKYIGFTYLGVSGTEGEQKFTGSYTYIPDLDSAIVEHDSLHRPIRKEPLVKAKKVYVYAVIEDGVNEPIYSELQAVQIEPQTILTLDVVSQSVSGGQQQAAQGKVEFDIDIAYTRYSDIEGFSFTVYYDFDDAGYNGFAIPSLTNISLSALENEDSLLQYIISDLNKLGNSATLYFYVVGKGLRSGAIRSAYTHAVHFTSPFIVKVIYNQNNNRRDVERMQVWLDMNANQTYDQGVDIVASTDHHGEASFFVGHGTYTVGLLPDSIQLAANTQVELKRTIDYLPTRPVYTEFTIMPPALSVAINYTMKDKSNSDILWALLGYPMYKNYFFIDLNGNRIWDNGEPREFINNSGECTLKAQQSHVMVYYVDVLATSTQLSVNDRKKLSCTKMKASLGANSLSVSKVANQYGIVLDSRDANADNQIELNLNGVLENF
ncbi:MAG: hypothetical protein MUE96_12425 [Bacteroidia bacterium]|jgi:hypothetical protein|nr:hypothetical protein [Bacteroidia bacterium]